MNTVPLIKQSTVGWKVKKMNLSSRRGLIGGFLGLLAGSIAGKRSAQAAPPDTSNPLDRFSTFDAANSSVASFLTRPPHIDRSQVAWMYDAINRMSTIREGMTRSDLEQVFEPAGGWNKLTTYSYRGCEFFKVTVEFKTIHEPYRNVAGDLMRPQEPREVITKISKPFVEPVYGD